jgi:hypothetical protein
MEDYLVELYAWISSTDPTFEEREPYEEWKKKIGNDEKYQQELYGWIASVDNTFEEREPFNLWAEKVKKKGDSQLTSPEEQLEYDIPGEGDPGSSDISQEEADAALEGDLETIIGEVPDEFGGGDVVQYEAGRRRRGQRSAIERSDRDIAAENRRRRDEGLPPIATGEKDTWLERTVGKNEVTDFFGDLWRAGSKGYQTGNTIDEALEVSFKGAAASDSDIADFIKVNEQISAIGISDEMKAFNKAYDSAGGGAWGFIKGIMAAPTSITEIAVTSVAQMVNPAVLGAGTAVVGSAAAGGAGVGAAAGGVGALPGAAAGALGSIPYALGAMGATLEAGLSFSEFLQEELSEKGLEMTKENVRKVLQDEDAMFRIRTKAAGRGVVIGVIDGITAGIAGKVAGKVGKKAIDLGKSAKKANLRALTAATGVEGVGGGIGEAAARLAVGQDMDAAEIGFEAVGGAPGSVISAIRSMAGKGKYTMGPDNAEVTFEDMVRIIQETDDATFAGMKLNIKGDNVLKQMAEERKNKLKKKKAKMESLTEDLQGLSAEDANTAIDLEVELDDVRNAISRAKRRRKTEIESQLDEIYSRRGETVDIEGEIAAIDERLNEINNQEAFTEQDIAEKNELEARKEGLQNQQQDAIQESSTTEVDVQEQAEAGETVGEGDAEGGVATEGEVETEVSAEATPQEIEQGADDLNELLNALGGAVDDSPVNLGDGFSGRNRGQEEGATTTEEIDQTTVEVDPDVQPDNNNVVVEDTESQTVEIAQSIDEQGNSVMAPKRKGRRIKQGLTVVDNVEGEVDSYYQSDTYNTENPNQDVSAHEQRITRLADKALNAIQKLFPDVNIVLHRSDQTYKDHVGKESRGAYKSATNTIHINMPKADALTIAHEVFHAVLKNKLGVEGKIQNVSKRMVKRLKKALKKSKNLTTEEQAALQDYADQFESNLQNEEYLAELVGYLASTYKKLDVPARAVVKEWIQSILDFIGLDISIGDINADERAVVDLLNVIAEKVTEGKELTAQDLQALDTEVGVEQQVEDQAKRDAQFTEEQVLEAPESRRGGRQIKKAFADLNKATTPEAQLGAIQELLNNVSQGAVLTAQEQATVDQTLTDLKNQGYELGKEVGGELALGDIVTLESLTIADNVSADAINTEGATKKVITKITKPQINKDGVMIQAAEVRVETQERTDAEIDAQIRSLEKLLQAEQKLGKDTSSTQKTIDALKAFKEKRGVEVSPAATETVTAEAVVEEAPAETTQAERDAQFTQEQIIGDEATTILDDIETTVASNFGEGYVYANQDPQGRETYSSKSEKMHDDARSKQRDQKKPTTIRKKERAVKAQTQRSGLLGLGKKKVLSTAKPGGVTIQSQSKHDIKGNPLPSMREAQEITTAIFIPDSKVEGLTAQQKENVYKAAEQKTLTELNTILENLGDTAPIKDSKDIQAKIKDITQGKKKRGVTAPAVERRKAEPQRTETPQQEFDRKKAEQQAKDKAKAERKRKIEEDVRKEGGRKTPGVKFSGRLANYGDTVGTLILNPGDTFTVEATVTSDMDVQKFGPKNQPREFNVSIGDNGQFVLGRMDPNMDPRMVEEIKRFIDESNKEFRGRSDVSQIALLGLGGKLKNRYKPRGFKMDLTEVSGVSRDQGRTKTQAFSPRKQTKKEFVSSLKDAVKGKGEFAHMTAENPGNQPLSATENAKRNAQLKAELKDLGYEVVEIDGMYDRAEKSFFVPGITEADAVRLGKKYGQESVAHSKGMLYTTGDNKGKRNPVTGDITVSETLDNFYSTIETKDGKMKYSINYDFSVLTDQEGKAPQGDVKTQKIMSTNNSLRNLGRQYNMNKQGFTPSYINLAALKKAARKLGFGVKKARGPQGGYYFTRNGRFVNVMENMTKTQIFKKGMSVGDVIKFARENNFTDAMIKDYLVRIEKMKVKDVNTLLALDADMFRRMPAVFADIDGGAKAGMKLFNKILNFNEKLQKDNKKKKTKLTEAEIMDATIEFMEEQPEFQAMSETKTIQSKKQMEMIVGLQKAMDSKPTKDMNTRLRSLRKSIRDRKRGAKNLQKVKAQLRNFIRQTLPSIKGSTYTRSELMGFIRKVTNANETNIDNIMDEVFDFVTKRQVKTLDAKIDSILNGKYEIVQSGRRKGVKIDNETRRRLEAIKKVITDDAATADDIVNSNLSLNEMFNALAEKVDQTEQDRNDMIDLMVVMSINNSKLMDDTNVNKVESLSRAEEMLSGIIGEGRQNFKEELKAAHEKYTEQFRKVFKDVTGRDVDVNNPDVVNEINDATDDLKRSAEATKANDNRVVRFIKSLNPKNLFVKAETIEGLMERIAEAPGVLLGGNARKLVYKGLNEGIRKYKKRMLDTKKELKSKMKEIYGKKWRTINKDNSIKQVVDGVYTDPEAVQKAQEAYDADPTRKNKRNLKRVKKDKSITLSKNQVGYLYMQMQDPANAPAFENMKGLLGKDYKKTMDALTEWAGPDVIAMAEWQMNEFYPSLYPGINDAYRDIYRTDLPWNENYGGRMYREGEVIAPLDLLGEKGRSQLSNSQVAAASTKERTATSKPIMPVDMMNALVTYTQDMEWFANVGPTIRDVNKLFTNPLMRKAIINAKGEVTMDMIDHAIKNIANRGLQTEKGNQFVNSMNNLFATTRLGISPNIAIKQLTSIPTYALDIGVGNYLYYAAKNKTQFLKVFNEIRENSVYLQDRLSTDIRQSIEAYSAQGLDSNNPATGAFTKGAGSFFVNMMMGFVKAGDITAIYLGGMPNYSYYKAEFMKANPEATNQEAIEYAVRKFEADTKSTQQSMDVTDKDYFQTSSPFNRALNMFKTSPKQYLRKEMSGLRNMRRGFRDKNLKQFMGGLNTFLMYHVMMPMGFQFVAAGMGLAGWDDEDNKDLARAAILGNFNALFIVGDILQGISNTLAGRTYGKDVGTLPVFDAFGEINEQYLKWIRVTDEQKKEEAFIRMTTRIGEIALKGGIPLYNIARFYKNIEKAADADEAGEVILRLLNYSDYVIEGNERDTKSAPKTREERDNLKEKEVNRKKEEEKKRKEARDKRDRR